ncbi:hypothetical protein [Streptomyces sp. NPDC008121]|uniref:hypothetical protein n=1 Tax=Streptomyces sp. NPDC008121 TaxID=3364809 RepID=UPI0036ED677E
MSPPMERETARTHVVVGVFAAALTAVFLEAAGRAVVRRLVHRRYARLDRAWARTGRGWGRTDAGS